MLCIKTKDAASAWEKSFLLLYENGSELEFNNFYKNECAAIEIDNIYSNNYSSFFPMSREAIDRINTYIVYGEGEIEHEWTKLYRERLFVKQNYVKTIIDILTVWPDCPRAQVAVWNNETDHNSKIAPCLQILWFKIINESLHLHVHMRTSDCYGKLLMNFNEFIAIQKYVAEKISLKTGKYVQFIDSLHFHMKDRDDVDRLYKLIITNNRPFDT
ncbi:thymidylate synthase [Candidatus Magnetomonas plexicatena]|uniref:thymidylate synthase n=1 Tax=Candidatus Magnetomonas plexicatena TaxID=2552947 RepID=UPI0011046CE6|nr:hypothetical protein E2O03_010105 [Nitrospirales bacterium LBB_01]